MTLAVAAQVGPVNTFEGKVTILKLTCSSTYVSGGDELDLSDYADEEILHVEMGSPMGSVTDYKLLYVNDDYEDLDGGKLEVHYWNYDLGSDGVSIEVPSGTSIANIITTCRIVAK